MSFACNIGEGASTRGPVPKHRRPSSLADRTIEPKTTDEVSLAIKCLSETVIRD